MTFDYDEITEVLRVTKDDGTTEKYVFRKPVGKLFSMILQQMENLGEGGTADVAEWAKADNSDKIPEEKIPDVFDNVDVVAELPAEGVQDKIYIVTGGDDAGKKFYWDGTQFVEMPDEGGITIGTVTGTAYDGGKGTELEGMYRTLEATVFDKLGVNDVSAWAKAQDPSTIPLEKMDENVVKYSDFSYTPSGESQPVERKTIQLANYDSISGKNTTGDDAANLIMMSKWDKVDIGSSRYPVNLNGSEFTLNDEKVIATTDQIPDVSNFASKEEVASAVSGLASTGYVDQKVAEIQIPDVSDLKANVQTVGESVQIGQESKGINLKTSGDVYSGAMVNSLGYIPTMTPYPGQDGRYVLQMRNHDSLSGVGTDGATGGNLAMLSKYDVADFGSKNFHTNLNVKEDNGHNGRVTVNDNNEVAYLSDIPSVADFATKGEVSTATANLVPNTRTVVGKSLDSDVTLASTDLTDGDTIARNTITVNEKPLTENVVLYAADIKEKNGSADTVYDLMPKIVACPIDARVVKDSYTVAEIFAMFGGATTMTEVRVFADRGVNYLRMSNSIGSYQNYMIPVNYYQIPTGTGTTGTITLIGVGPNPDNKDLITKFTITMTLNGDASTITVGTKALEVES